MISVCFPASERTFLYVPSLPTCFPKYHRKLIEVFSGITRMANAVIKAAWDFQGLVLCSGGNFEEFPLTWGWFTGLKNFSQNVSRNPSPDSNRWTTSRLLSCSEPQRICVAFSSYLVNIYAQIFLFLCYFSFRSAEYVAGNWQACLQKES